LFRTKPFAIEKMDTPQAELDRLNNILAREDLGKRTKTYQMQRVTGICAGCDSLPTYIVKYKIGRKGGAIRIGRYCDKCLAKYVPMVKA